jgi:pyruvate-formate lyase-activating enzyme
MKYFLAYPISKSCNLRCYYCYHTEHFESNFDEKQRFTFKDYIRFRDTHLKDAEEIIVHFHGGEPFLKGNSNTICSFLRNTKMEKADLLTNGLQDKANYEKLLPLKDRIHRIGITFHRKIIGGVKSYVQKYEDNVKWMHSQGIPIYVKELMLPEFRDEIKAYKRYWKSLGIPYKIQDFRGVDRGFSRETYKEYEAIDILMVDSEYKHGGDYCSCMKGYKNILIRGGWMSGSIIACFEDPKCVGSLLDNTYNPNYKICRDTKLGRINIMGVPEVYLGTFKRDLPKPKYCGQD